jgi:hypothetical protein
MSGRRAMMVSLLEASRAMMLRGRLSIESVRYLRHPLAVHLEANWSHRGNDAIIAVLLAFT